jgi:hypothetical protein
MNRSMQNARYYYHPILAKLDVFQSILVNSSICSFVKIPSRILDLLHAYSRIEVHVEASRCMLATFCCERIKQRRYL